MAQEQITTRGVAGRRKPGSAPWQSHPPYHSSQETQTEFGASEQTLSAGEQARSASDQARSERNAFDAATSILSRIEALESTIMEQNAMLDGAWLDSGSAPGLEVDLDAGLARGAGLVREAAAGHHSEPSEARSSVSRRRRRSLGRLPTAEKRSPRGEGGARAEVSEGSRALLAPFYSAEGNCFVDGSDAFSIQSSSSSSVPCERQVDDLPPGDRVLPPEDRVLPPEDRVLPPEDRVLPPEDPVLSPLDRVVLALPPLGSLSAADVSGLEWRSGTQDSGALRTEAFQSRLEAEPAPRPEAEAGRATGFFSTERVSPPPSLAWVEETSLTPPQHFVRYPPFPTPAPESGGRRLGERNAGLESCSWPKDDAVCSYGRTAETGSPFGRLERVRFQIPSLVSILERTRREREGQRVLLEARHQQVLDERRRKERELEEMRRRVEVLRKRVLS
ncbi:hypothetical protein GNI_138910 [Gregarina niphandrodes]|uniref:Uncharacterized protein n=1 Tax=Gregarina niphandrodes TaxID=110365 RepID=A0A023B0Q8_GRENI|nr:hypothetical protein GNI_138910 [Gregarina niphandrodes]EZG45377.1 hypothetical protein GNI_138910 [Gregarina niphandrodes]|eukprot:XP_011132514.1 hypothetical protein GNI_138910 [Gregarina niphandrodes]